MKFISLFSGIGGFDLALIRQGHECVWANEWDKYAAQIYDKNFFNQSSGGFRQEENLSQGGGNTDTISQSNLGQHTSHIDTRDIRTVSTEEIPDHDLLVGGFPCQAFSIAGKRRGFDDTRGTLFFEVARILREKQPRLCILENVKGLLSHDNGNTFKTIISTLVELGYDIQWQVLNSKNFGVPQNRERVFIIGHLRGTSRPQVFPITEGSQGNLKYCGGVISAREQWLRDGHTNSRNFSQGQRIYSTDGISQTLAGNAGGQGGKTGLYQIAKTVRSGDRGSPYGSKQNWDSYEFEGRIRRLTPTECERLQGFPDGWTEGVSDTQRYKCLGNAVTVSVVEYIVSKLKQWKLVPVN